MRRAASHSTRMMLPFITSSIRGWIEARETGCLHAGVGQVSVCVIKFVLLNLKTVENLHNPDTGQIFRMMPFTCQWRFAPFGTAEGPGGCAVQSRKPELE